MSIVKMKTVTVAWSQTVYYKTTMEVPVEYTDSEIKDVFWELDLTGEEPIDYDDVVIDCIKTKD